MSNKISVITACYNCASTIEGTFDSVKNQSFTDWEMIFVEDGDSDDDTHEKCLSIGQNNTDCNIKIIRLPENKGATITRHIGFERSSGKYILPLDSDDLIDKDYMLKSYYLLEDVRNQDKAFTYCDTFYFYANGKIEKYQQPEYNFIRLIEGNYLSYCSLIKRNSYFDCGGYNLENRGFCEDYELYLKLGMKGFYGLHVPEPLFYYRVREDSVSHNDIGQVRMNLAKMYFIKKYPNIFPIEWQKIADKELKKYKLPENFMSLKNEEFKKYLGIE